MTSPRVEAVAKLHFEHDLKDYTATAYAPDWGMLPPAQRRSYIRRAERDVAIHDALTKKRTNEQRKAAA
jgi:hypothetical protein